MVIRNFIYWAYANFTFSAGELQNWAIATIISFSTIFFKWHYSFSLG